MRRLAWLGAMMAVGIVAASVGPVWALSKIPPPTSAFMLRSHYADPATGEGCDEVEYFWVERDSISPDLRLAVVLAEDQRFLLHDGFDLKSLTKAIRERQQGRVRGASSITQQVAKNLFLWPGPSYVRKGIEAWLTVWIEQLWNKQRILEVYLNVAQFGPCLFGAGAASERFFGVPAIDLEPEQAALLASVLPNPGRLRAHNPGPYLTQRRAQVLELMNTHRGASHLRGL